MFRVGDLVTGVDESPYGCTSEYSLCVVDEIIDDSSMNVTVVIHKDGDWGRCTNTSVEKEFFKHCTYEEFMQTYPEAEFIRGWSLARLNEIINTTSNKEEKKVELKMDKETIGSYTLTDEEKASLREEMMKLLVEYDYDPTDSALNIIIDTWIKNKGWMVNLFKKHPNYNGKYQIVFDTDYNRVTNKNEIYQFSDYVRRVSRDMFRVEKQIGKFSYYECRKIYRKLNDLADSLSFLIRIGYNPVIDGKTAKQWEAERLRWKEKYEEYVDTCKIDCDEAFDREKWDIDDKLYYITCLINEMGEHIADEDFADNINRRMPEVKAVNGQKVSRIVGKIAKITGIDKDENWNRQYAKYCDAINPLSIKRHTILSCHPVDYLTMSFGNSWASCHTIDKHNKRGMPNDYSGCYSSGTLSYMLDESSFVYYTVDKSYNGNEYELQDKINRNMFHMGEDKLIQARVYPQATDGEKGIYKQIREIAQKVISDCLGVSNMWVNVKGTEECKYSIHSHGTHYRDYTNFSDCNVSYLKYEEDNTYRNKNRIHVGHDPICVHCGYKYDWAEAVECQDCYEDNVTCYNCDHTYDRDDMHYIDGEWYCEDCCFYCEYHEEWEVGDYTYVENYGRVCDYALENGDFYRCEHCYEYHYDDDHIEAEDGTTFCCESCAEREGYMMLYDVRWYPEDDVYYCEHCERYVHRDDWNSELECCIDCEDEVETEREEELAEVV